MQEENKFGRFGAMMAMAGSAIGLGNLWRFPYLLGEHGGSAFLFVYLICALLIALPIFFCEFIIGRRSGVNCMGAFRNLSDGKGLWKYSGVLCVFTCVLIFSYYSVIGGWCVQYFFRACQFSFEPGMSSEELSSMFTGFVSSIWAPLFGFVSFVLITGYIVLKGVKSGIEKFGKVAMPVLAVIIIAMAVYVAFLPGSEGGYLYMFKTDFSKINGSVIIAALGQSFFSLSLGCGCIITYSSYVKKSENILFHSVGTGFMDVLFAVIAGCAIMPAVFAFNVDPGAGPSLVYETLPFIFSRMPAGGLVAIIFFGALLVATVTSSISMCEVGVAFLTQEKGMNRREAVSVVIAIALVVGLICSLSFGPLSGFKILGDTFFDFCDKVSSNFLMILGAMLAVLFVGWKMKRSDVYDEFVSGGLKEKNRKFFGVSYFLIKYVAPLAIVIIFISGLFNL